MAKFHHGFSPKIKRKCPFPEVNSNPKRVNSSSIIPNDTCGTSKHPTLKRKSYRKVCFLKAHKQRVINLIAACCNEKPWRKGS